MPRNGSGVYSVPPSTEGSPGNTILSSAYNAFLADLVSDLNDARPISAGGTGGTTAAEARTNLGLVIGTNVQAYDADLTAIATAFTAASASGPASLALAEDTDNGTSKVTLQAPSALSADATVTLPDTTGTLYASGGTDVALADGGTGASLTDPNADRILFWDDSAGAMTWLSLGAGLDLTGTTLTNTGGMTLLGTITTTTGSTQSLINIPTTYQMLLLVFVGVSHNSGTNQTITLALSSNNGSAYGTGIPVISSLAGSTTPSAMVWVANSGQSGLPKQVNTFAGGAVAGSGGTESTITGLINAVQIAPSGGSFDAGAVYVYGM